eukprot:767223-Hanusia_phi.AAC.4
METTSRSKSYVRLDFPQPCALVLGNELTAVAVFVSVAVADDVAAGGDAVMEQCDELVEIPTFGIKVICAVVSSSLMS